MACYERNNWKTIFKKCQNSFPKKFKLIKVDKVDFLTSHNETMLFEELNVHEFEEAFKSWKRNKAAGFDDSSSNIILLMHMMLAKYPVPCFYGLNSTRNISW